MFKEIDKNEPIMILTKDGCKSVDMTKAKYDKDMGVMIIKETEETDDNSCTY